MGDDRDARAVPREGVAVFAVSDLEASLAHYTGPLGFDEVFRWGDPAFYAGVCQGAVTLHLTTAENRRASVGLSVLSLFVEDADAARAGLVERGARVSVEIADRPYGLRDFAVDDLDGNRLIFGSEIERSGGG